MNDFPRGCNEQKDDVKEYELSQAGKVISSGTPQTRSLCGKHRVEPNTGAIFMILCTECAYGPGHNW